VALSLSLRMVEALLVKDPDRATSMLHLAREELGQALEELRELARGIHPAVLADRGLLPALEALVGRCPIPVELEVETGDRFPEQVEAGLYYTAAEALTNVAKYADASLVTLRVRHENGHAVVEINDDGAGGADPTRGTGLRGLADRIEALGGRLELESPPGVGTNVRAVVPAA
jgi:signal transduction histidine kinase